MDKEKKMSDDLGKIVVDGEQIDLHTISNRKLEKLFSQITDEEAIVKQELEDILKKFI